MTVKAVATAHQILTASSAYQNKTVLRTSDSNTDPFPTPSIHAALRILGYLRIVLRYDHWQQVSKYMEHPIQNQSSNCCDSHNRGNDCPDYNRGTFYLVFTNFCSDVQTSTVRPADRESTCTCGSRFSTHQF